MKLKYVLLENFRNHVKRKLEFKENINIIAGRNAIGKTNILEAIYFIATTKSHRTSSVRDLIQKESGNFYIKGEAERNGCPVTVEIGASRSGKKAIKLNHQPVRARKDIVGQVPVVFFSPEDLYLVKEDPSFRRKFLDIFISQVDRKYLDDLQQYHKIIFERNRALSQVREGTLGVDMLEVWDEQAVNTGLRIATRRGEAIHRLNDICSGIHREISGSEEIKLEYDTCAANREEYLKKLTDNRQREIEHGVTRTGPHRDDLRIFLNGNNIRQFGSQGQQRTAALSLKLGELELMKEIIGEYPLIMFDDVMSELDGERQRYFLDILQSKGAGSIQSFITTTEINAFDSSKANIIKLEE